jgi:mycothiol synthase
VADLLRACDVANYGEPDTSIEDVRDDWCAPHFELARDAWIIQGSSPAPSGYAWLRVRRSGGDFDAVLAIRPGESIPALAPALLDAVESRARERSRESAATLCFFNASVEIAKRSLFERSGYHEARTFYRMRIDFDAVSELPRPGAPGIEVRPLRVGTDDRVAHETIEESFAEHFRHTPREFEEWWALRTSHPRFDAGLWLLAWDGDRVAGALIAYDYGDIGFIQELGVLKPWRGRGVGTALLSRSFEEFRGRRQAHVVLGVDAENESAIGLYKRAGMRVEQRHHLMRKRIGL